VPKWSQNENKKQHKTCFLVVSDPKTGFYAFLPFWCHLGNPKEVSKGPKVGGKYGPILKLKDKTLIMRPILSREIIQKQPENRFYVSCFLLILGPFRHPQMDPKR
jgi:hypothetical protein